MTVTMDDTQITTLEQIKQVLKGAQAIAFKGVRWEPIYRWIEAVLKRFDYFELGRKDKGAVKTYLQRLSGFSRAQMTRLLLKCLLEGAIRPSRARRNRFPAKYTDAHKALLALTDNAHGRLSGPATKPILERAQTFADSEAHGALAHRAAACAGDRSVLRRAFQRVSELPSPVRLKSIKDAGRYLREGVTLEYLDAVAARQTENESATAMQEARNRLFKKFGTGRGPAARSVASPRKGA